MTTHATSPNMLAALARQLALCTSLTIATVAMTQAAHAAPNDAFFRAGYNYCDAKLIAAYWKMDTDKAKIEASIKIRKNGKNSLKAVLVEGRKVARCEWTDTQYSFEQMETLAKYWGTPTTYDAKVKVGDLFTRGRSGQVAQALKRAG